MELTGSLTVMGPKHRILIIDDDPIYVKATRAVLEARGYLVDSATNGDEGLAKLARNKPDLVLLDVMMSWPLEGVSVSRKMLSRRALRDIPIIMISAIRESEYRGVFPQDEYLHIDGWLDKPCAPDVLMSEIEAILERGQRHKAHASGEMSDSETE